MDAHFGTTRGEEENGTSSRTEGRASPIAAGIRRDPGCDLGNDGKAENGRGPNCNRETGKGSWRDLYPQLAGNCVDDPPDAPAVYFLILGNEIVYVGSSITPKVRIYWHGCTSKEFDSVVFMQVAGLLLRDVEKQWIRRIKPRYNKVHKNAPGEMESTRLPKWFMRRIRLITAVTDESIPEYIVRTLEDQSRADFDAAIASLPGLTDARE